MGQHKNCKFVAHPSDESALFTVIFLRYPFMVWYPWWTTVNLSGHESPPSQLLLSTEAGHSNIVFEDQHAESHPLLASPICIVFDLIPGPTLATLQSEKC